MIEIFWFISLMLVCFSLFVIVISLVEKQIFDIITINGKEVFSIHKILDVIVTNKKTPDLPKGFSFLDMFHGKGNLHFSYCIYVSLIDIAFVICLGMMTIVVGCCIFAFVKHVFKFI